ncbi:MAG: hypothetical protein PHR00_04435 [Patescibacteria group bacterium]|nr:hypothetical protein [Patescibacteria group bacterium]
MDIQEIVENANMSARPGYYSGRGATLSDLNDAILNKIAKSIKENYGDKAFDSFVSMVWDMKVLSATAFLNNLYTLESVDWDLSQFSLTNSDKHFENEGEAIELVATVFSRSSKDNDSTDFFTDLIRKNFVRPNLSKSSKESDFTEHTSNGFVKLK